VHGHAVWGKEGGRRGAEKAGGLSAADQLWRLVQAHNRPMEPSVTHRDSVSLDLRLQAKPISRSMSMPCFAARVSVHRAGTGRLERSAAQAVTTGNIPTGCCKERTLTHAMPEAQQQRQGTLMQALQRGGPRPSPCIFNPARVNPSQLN
jgi:hypothetical protein